MNGVSLRSGRVDDGRVSDRALFLRLSGSRSVGRRVSWGAPQGHVAGNNISLVEWVQTVDQLLRREWGKNRARRNIYFICVSKSLFYLLWYDCRILLVC